MARRAAGRHLWVQATGSGTGADPLGRSNLPGMTRVVERPVDVSLGLTVQAQLPISGGLDTGDLALAS